MLTSRGDVVATGGVLSHGGLYRVLYVDIRYTRVLEYTGGNKNIKHTHTLLSAVSITSRKVSGKGVVYSDNIIYMLDICIPIYVHTCICRYLQAIHVAGHSKHYCTYKKYMCRHRNHHTDQYL